MGKGKSPVPDRIRRLVLARAGGWCEMCGQPRPLDAHHRMQRSVGGRHDVGNLLALCRGCHTTVHARIVRSHDLGRLVHSWDAPGQMPVLLSMGWVLLTEDGQRLPHPGYDPAPGIVLTASIEGTPGRDVDG